ncbi:MAG: N-glycosylase/DNA lyase [Candidatus Woesearchaeota archaeon]
MSLKSEILKLKKSNISKEINSRLKEFQELNKKGNNEWFSELCFCILTANSKAQTAMQIQDELKAKGFLEYSLNKIVSVIRKNNHRFHNNKGKYIVEARKFKNIKTILSKEKDPREFIEKNIKGLGWKESSHFLRNVGFTDYAILDRHILNLFVENKYIKEKPKSLNKNNYFEIEKIFQKLAKDLNMNCAELDMYMWFLKTNKVLK